MKKALFVLLITAYFITPHNAFGAVQDEIDERNKQIAEIQRQIDEYQKQITTTAAQAKTLANEVARLQDSA